MIVNQRFKRPVLGSCSAVAGFRRKVLASKKVPIPSVSVNVCRFESSLSLSRTLAAVDRNKIQIIGTVKYIETGKETKKKKKRKRKVTVLWFDILLLGTFTTDSRDPSYLLVYGFPPFFHAGTELQPGRSVFIFPDGRS